MNCFEALNKVNVNEKVERKNKNKYLSWSYAWEELKQLYPESTYVIKKFGENQLPYVYDENTGYMVFTELTIEGLTHEMWLPVMDGANNAMKAQRYSYQVKDTEYLNGYSRQKKDENGNLLFIDKYVEPATMFDINKTIMRCLVKNIAMFGLGLYIYLGEDLPEIDPKEEQEAVVSELVIKSIKDLLNKTGIERSKIFNEYDVQNFEEMTVWQGNDCVIRLKEKVGK
jgi:hypothetical protein